MKRIEKIDPGTLTGEAREIFDRWSPGGNPLNIVLIYFRNTELNRNWSYMATHLFFKNALSDRQREIIVLRISWQCVSDYEFIQHVRIAREGELLSDAEINDLLKPAIADSWSESERALVSATDELMARHSISAETWQVLKAHLSVHQLMDAVATAGGYALNSMATNSFGVDIESTMHREEGLVPSVHAPAFRFLNGSTAPTLPSTARIESTALSALTEREAPHIEPYIGGDERRALLEMLAGYPRLLRDWMPIIHYVDKQNTLDAAARALVAVRTAARCHCLAELQDRLRVARQAGFADADFADLRSDGPIAGGTKRSLLARAVDELIDDMIVSEQTWTAMRAEFSDEQMMDVVFATATELMICWMLNALGVDTTAVK